MPSTGRGLFFLVKEFNSKNKYKKLKRKNFKSILSSSLSKVVSTRLFNKSNQTKNKRRKTVLSKSECFCENTSELQFAH